MFFYTKKTFWIVATNVFFYSSIRFNPGPFQIALAQIEITRKRVEKSFAELFPSQEVGFSLNFLASRKHTILFTQLQNNSVVALFLWKTFFPTNQVFVFFRNYTFLRIREEWNLRIWQRWRKSFRKNRGDDWSARFARTFLLFVVLLYQNFPVWINFLSVLQSFLLQLFAFGSVFSAFCKVAKCSAVAFFLFANFFAAALCVCDFFSVLQSFFAAVFVWFQQTNWCTVSFCPVFEMRVKSWKEQVTSALSFCGPFYLLLSCSVCARRYVITLLLALKTESNLFSLCFFLVVSFFLQKVSRNNIFLG